MAALFNIVKSFVDSGLSDWLKKKYISYEHVHVHRRKHSN